MTFGVEIEFGIVVEIEIVVRFRCIGIVVIRR